MPSSGHQKLLRDIELLVENNLQNVQFGVEELAECVGMSRSHLHRKLKEATGQSVTQFIREYRLQKARDLLQNQDLTASEVAYQVGFGSPTYFSKSFHDFYGFTPGEARQKADEISLPPTPIIQEEDHKKSIPFRWKGIIGGSLLIATSVLVFVLSSSEADEISAQADKSIAILPFRNLSTETDNQYFVDGVMDAILTKLSKIGKLKVTSRTSVEKYRHVTSKTIPEIADELHVTYILEGSAQKYREEIRINAQLINALNDQYVWSQDYTRQFEDVLSLQSEIAEKVAAELKAVLTNDEMADIRKLPTHVPEAYNYFLLAKFQFNKWTDEGFQSSIPFFEKAIALDSTYVDAYVGLADVWNTGGLLWGIYPEDEAWATGKALLEKALEIDPNHALGLSTLGTAYFYYGWNFEQASACFERAQEIRGYYSDLCVDFFIKTHQLEKALRIVNNLMALDPSNSIFYYIKAEVLYFMGNAKEALQVLDEGIDLFDDLYFVRESAKLYFLYGEIEKSKQALKKHKYLFQERPPVIIWLEAVHAFQEGRNPLPFIDQLKDQYAQNTSGSPAWFIALTYAAIGDTQTMLHWLEKSYDRHEVEMTWLKMEPALAPYKNEPKYLALLEQMKFPE